MRTFEELKSIFTLLKNVHSSNGLNNNSQLLMRYKWLASLVTVIYPKGLKKLYDYDAYIDGMGQFIYQGIVNDCEEIVYETSLLHGDVDTYVLAYMHGSPFWETVVVGLGCDYFEDELEKIPFLDLLRKRFGDFFEECLYDTSYADAEEHPLKPLHDMFGYDDREPLDDMCVIKSLLYPYVAALKAMVREEHKEYIRYLDEAFKVVRDWMCGKDYYFSTMKYGYFACCDASSRCFSWGIDGGALELKPQIIICGELIERIMFDMDDIYHFLPESVRALRKEVLN